jgi:hypothetical protein
MFKHKHAFMNLAEGEQSSGGGETATPEATQAATTQTGSVLSTVGKDEQKPVDAPIVPEKYQVKKEDGSIDVEASAKKLADAHSALEKRLGTSELPPKSADEYAPNVEIENFNWDEFKADPEMQGFLKGAHAKGITNEQLSFVLGEYINRVPALGQANQVLNQQTAEEELRKTWANDKDFTNNTRDALKAFETFASPDDKARIDEIGNNPIVVRLLANIGKQLKEDSVIEPGSVSEQSWTEETNKIRANPAYTDKAHPEHKQLVARMNALYDKRYGTNKQVLGRGATVSL